MSKLLKIANDLRNLGKDKFVTNVIDDIYIVEVDGEKIRDELEIEYTMGGHHYRYPEIDEREIWIEDDIAKPLDRVATIEHELTERLLMKFLGYSYDEAHKLASATEAILRKYHDKRKL